MATPDIWRAIYTEIRSVFKRCVSVDTACYVVKTRRVRSGLPMARGAGFVLPIY